jgi:hypothetical protein
VEPIVTRLYYSCLGFPVKLWAATMELEIGESALPRTLGEVELARMNQPAQEFLEEEGADLAPNRAETAVEVGSVGENSV